MSLFRHEELELLVCGLPHLAFEALQAAARYEAGFHAAHPTIQALWRVVNAFSLDKKKHFLFFTTGCDRCCFRHSHASVACRSCGLTSMVLLIMLVFACWLGKDCRQLSCVHAC